MDARSRLVAAWHARGRAAHPGVELQVATFARFVEDAVAPVVDGEATEAEAGGEDLYLACACAAGAPGAADRFEVLHGAGIKRSVARMLSNPSDREEAVQRTRQTLLAGTSPRIAQYRGRGPLARWVSVAATRVALSTGRAESAERRLRQKLVASTIGVESPESRLIRRELRARIEEAIGEALAQLESRDRLVLRLHLVSGMSITSIAGIFGVNHSTIGRRMRRVCDRLLEQITKSLKEIRVGESDLASVLQVVASQLDLSLARLLPAA